MKATYFTSADAFRTWLESHHASTTELLVGFYKRASAKTGITYPEALDEALAFGWIDGVRRGVDTDRYTIRFTPRTATSIWSAVNIKRVTELEAAGRMRAPGLAAFAKRDEKRSRSYAYEQKAAALDEAALAEFRRNAKAFAFYETQAPWYRRTTAHWVTSAKQAETRARRLAHLIDCSGRGMRIDMLKPSAPERGKTGGGLKQKSAAKSTRKRAR